MSTKTIYNDDHCVAKVKSPKLETLGYRVIRHDRGRTTASDMSSTQLKYVISSNISDIHGIKISSNHSVVFSAYKDARDIEKIDFIKRARDIIEYNLRTAVSHYSVYNSKSAPDYEYRFNVDDYELMGEKFNLGITLMYYNRYAYINIKTMSSKTHNYFSDLTEVGLSLETTNALEALEAALVMLLDNVKKIRNKNDIIGDLNNVYKKSVGK